MKLNKIIPVSEVNDKIVTKLEKVIAPIAEDIEAQSVARKIISPARVHLELNAENMSPEEYIAARRYIADLEMSNFIASEMKSIK